VRIPMIPVSDSGRGHASWQPLKRVTTSDTVLHPIFRQAEMLLLGRWQSNSGAAVL